MGPKNAICLVLPLCVASCSATPPDSALTAIANSAIATSVAETQQPAHAYESPSPLAVAQLLVPTEDLASRWMPVGVADLTQPLSPTCGYFGGCAEGWPGAPDYGALLRLEYVPLDLVIGYVAYLHFEEAGVAEDAFRALAESEESNPGFGRVPSDRLGEEAYSVFERSLLQEEGDLPVANTRLAFRVCRGIVSLSMMSPTEGEGPSLDDFLSDVYRYADELEKRFEALACEA